MSVTHRRCLLVRLYSKFRYQELCLYSSHTHTHTHTHNFLAPLYYKVTWTNPVRCETGLHYRKEITKGYLFSSTVRLNSVQRKRLES
jgi:hypothetical protein